MRHYIRKGTRERLLRGETVNWIVNRPKQSARYIAAIVISSPPWLTLDHKREIKLLAAWCEVLAIFTGKPHNLDHIVPVHHPLVCGLTVPWNLQAINGKSNMSKGNTFNPNQGELFDTPTSGPG